jgi:hypothetical protein
MIGMGFRQTFQQTQRLECSVCKQPFDDEHVRDSETCGVMFGYANYAICCCCRQEVTPDTAGSRLYRNRWRRWYRRLGIVGRPEP